MSGLEAARVGDQIGHSQAKAWFNGGLIAGALIGAALIIGTILTGGAALAIVAASLTAVSTTAGLGVAGAYYGASRPSGGDDPAKSGHRVTSGSPDVFVMGYAAVRAGQDVCTDSDHIAQGSSLVLIDRKLASRKSDKTECGGHITTGAMTVMFGGDAATAAGMKIREEVSSSLLTTLKWTALIAGGAAVAITAGWMAIPILGLSFVGGEILGHVGRAIGEACGSESTARAGEIIGGFVGGALGGFGAAKMGGLFSRPRAALTPKTEPAVNEGTPLARVPSVEAPSPKVAPLERYYKHQYGEEVYYSRYQNEPSVKSVTDMLDNVHAHKIRVAKVTDDVLQQNPDRYGHLDRDLALEYAREHDTAKVNGDPAFLKEHGLERPVAEDLLQLWAKPVSGAQGLHDSAAAAALKRMNVADKAHEEAFFTKRGMSAEEAAPYREVVDLADKIDKGMDPMSRHEELGRAGSPASEYMNNPKNKWAYNPELAAIAKKTEGRYSEIIPESDQYLNFRVEAQRLREAHEVSGYTRTDGELLLKTKPEATLGATAPAKNLGDLRPHEIQQIQAAADEMGADLWVTGSAAKGLRRNLDTDLPIKGFATKLPKKETRSDIDYATANGNGPKADKLKLPDIDDSFGVREIDYINLKNSPAIRFRPGQEPEFYPQDGRRINLVGDGS